MPGPPDDPEEPLPETAFVLGAVGLAFFLLFSIAPLVLHEFALGLPSVALAATALYAWLRHHRWIRTRTRGARLVLTLACWVWPLWLTALVSLLTAIGALPTGGGR